MRSSSVERKTKETEITVSLSLDGGNADIDTGIGFFDHMLTALALHGGFGLCVKVKGDYMLTVIILLKIPVLFWVRLFMKHLATRAE